jgi:hypothetical protein
MIEDDFGGSDYSAGERQQPKPAPRGREEILYVSEEYKLFILTAQPNSMESARIHLAVKPFHVLDDEAREQMLKVARPVTEDSDISIRLTRKDVELSDKKTFMNLHVPFAELAPDVQVRLRGNDASDPFVKYAIDLTRTTRNIPVGKPLLLRRTP